MTNQSLQSKIREAFKDLIAWGVYHSGLVWILPSPAFGRGDRKGIVVLYYHRITQNSDGDFLPIPMNCRRRFFERHMRILSKKFNVISLKTLYRIIQERSGIPDRCVAVTFDDGFKDVFETAFPILEKYQIPATIFLTVGMISSKELIPLHKLYYLLDKVDIESIINEIQASYPHLSDVDPPMFRALKETGDKIELRKGLDRLLGFSVCSVEGRKLLEALCSKFEVTDAAHITEKLYLSWDDVKKMDGEGISFGAHTMSHPILSDLEYGEQRSEIVYSKQIIETKLNKSVDFFAYPFGYLDERTKEIVKNNFLCAFSDGQAIGFDSDLLCLGRRVVLDQPVYRFVCELWGGGGVMVKMKKRFMELFRK